MEETASSNLQNIAVSISNAEKRRKDEQSLRAMKWY